MQSQTLSERRQKKSFYTILLLVSFLLPMLQTQAQKATKKPMNVIYILTDDHRFDFMGFTGKVPWLQTPSMDRLAKEGVYIPNATVTTSLCSPSRASILTGQYAHTHQVVDNFSPLPKNLTFFPEYLQKIGYRTAFFGKWHMGNTGDNPQKGFNHWESFKGQGVYYNPTLNIDGKRIQYKDSTYITDLLTSHATQWMREQPKDKPFFLYLSHKGVHHEFMPAPRHLGAYQGKPIGYPSTINLTAKENSKIIGNSKQNPTAKMVINDSNYNVKDIPNWVWTQRNSWHGVDFMYDGKVKFDDFYYSYCETLLAIDESIASVRKTLEELGIADNTMIVYMGDNGFLMGEHGLIDKRNMYEESQKVPLLVYMPGASHNGKSLNEIIQNVDIAPTILDVAGIDKPSNMQGQSFLPLLQDKPVKWRNKAFYEYYWEFSYPQTPTTFGVREGTHKFIFYPGIWDISEFYDLSVDPEEKKNLYRDPKWQSEIARMRKELWAWLQETGGLQIPLKPITEKRDDFGNKGLY